jgi:pyruvate dehydrogenase E1 component beta subunit
VTRELTYREALREALRAALAEDDRVLVLGQDVGARGGSYGVTAGLLEDFGAGRVLDAPSSEAAIVGVAIGAAMAGLRPVVELTTATFAGLAYDQLAHHAAPLRALSGGRVSAPFVLRMPQSAGGRLGPVHSSNVEALLHWLPGLTVWAPSSPGDAFAMLGAAIRSDDPVVVLEHTLLYDTVGPVADADAGPDAGAPFGALERRGGDDVALVATGRMVRLALDAAERLAAEDGVQASVVDLRALRPLDAPAVEAVVARTGRAVLVEEGPPHGGVTATLAALLPRTARVARVTGADAPVPYAAALEAAALPSAERIAGAARALLAEPAPAEAGQAEPAPPTPAGAPFTTTSPIDVEALLAARRATGAPLATLLADALSELLPTAIVTAGTDTTILGHLAPGPAPATLALGPVTTRPTVLDGAVTIRHVAPLTLTTTAHPDGAALFATIRERLAAG